MNFSALVVSYNCTLANSNTINSLLQAQLCKHHLTLYIWNNGPTPLDPEDIEQCVEKANAKQINVEIHQNINNIALSKVYNFFIHKASFDFFLILDQDSIIPIDFFSVAEKNRDLDIIIPLILSKQNRIAYPLDNATRKPILTEGIIDPTTIDSISSGLLLSANLINLFNAHKIPIFNEHFAFYGIDTVFFYELAAFSRQGLLIKAGCFNKLGHSLSIDEHESSDINKWRDSEYLFSDLLIRLHFKKKSRLSLLLWLIFKKRKHIQNMPHFISLIKCIITKTHPRANLPLDSNIE